MKEQNLEAIRQACLGKTGFLHAAKHALRWIDNPEPHRDLIDACNEFEKKITELTK